MVQPKKRLYRNDVSAETREKQSVAHQGRRHSNDNKQKISKAMCDYWAKLPTLYFSQAKDTDMKMRVYDKARELNENSPNKAERLKEWLGWDAIDTLYRVEVVMHNTNVREFVERYGERLYPECGEHSNVLNLLGMSDFRLAMFLDSVDRLIYFRNKRTREKISLVELASGI